MNKRALIVLASLLLLVTNISFAGQNTENNGGRYQIFYSPHARVDTYLVDTKTGKIWTSVQYTDVQGQPRVWIRQERIDSKKDFMKWLKQQTLIKQEK